MNKIIYGLIVALFVMYGLVFANHEFNNEIANKSIAKPLSADERNAAMKKWEATPDGILYKKWEASPEGKKVHARAAKIMKSIMNYTNMEGIVTSLSLPPGSRLGFGMMINIDGEDYILSFGPKKSDKFQKLHSLKVNDKIIIKSHSVSYAPKYSYPIIAGDYIEHDSKIIYKRPAQKDNC